MGKSNFADMWLTEFSDILREDTDRFLGELQKDADNYEEFVGKVHKSLLKYCLRGYGLGSVFALAIVRGLLGDENWRGPVRVATALELFAKSTLLADDIIDLDRKRWGYDAFHVEFEDFAGRQHWHNPERVGRSVGMLAAALLSSAGHLALCTAPLADRSYRKVAMIIADAQKRIDQSQLVDLRFENIIPTVAEWQNMARNRASAHLEATIHVGGIVANWTEQDAQELLLAATHMGFIYDIRADLLDTFGRPTRRRVVGRDLRMNKKPLFLCAAFEHLSPTERDELSVLIANEALPSEHMRELAVRLGVPTALESLREHSSRACEHIARSRLNDSAKRFFDQMIRRAARPPKSLVFRIS
jgi:geranylgeranyl pyrophosphate synthase